MRRRYTLITGGAGFIGANVARSFLEDGYPVQILDNLSRPGVERNIAELSDEFGDNVEFIRADVQDSRAVERAVSGASAIFHLAAQVAVTTSLENPIADLETNLIGTINVLEALRGLQSPAPLLFTSTNKVYGKLAGVAVREEASRYTPSDKALARTGVTEDQPLEFLSPYGCSKGGADQYVLDYARSYRLPCCVFRMSCIYGPYQMGSEDQGWVAHFLRQALKKRRITIFGDGKQVRDLLFVSDLVRAMRLVQENISKAAGQVFNMGGGSENSASLLDVIREIENLTGSPVEVDWGPERLGDQRWFVAGCGKIKAALGWSPETSVRQGLETLHSWYLNRSEIAIAAKAQVA